MTTKAEILLVVDRGCFRPYEDVGWEVFDNLPRGSKVMAIITQPRNPEHHAKLWALAHAVANFDKDFVDAEDAVEWAKLHIPNMHKEYRLRDGRLAIKTRSISWASMDQIKFARFYDRALWLWAQKIGCDPETLLAEADGKQLVIEGYNDLREEDRRVWDGQKENNGVEGENR